MESDKVSIIIPYKNLKDITQICIDSVLAYTHPESLYPLIFVDDGSDDPNQVSYPNYIQGIHIDTRIIRNDKSVGWCKSINQGCELIDSTQKSTKSEYVCFLNNDVVVTPNWLEKMIVHLESDPSLGIISPTTNQVAGYQHVDYNRPGVDFQYADVLTGFCLLLKRELFDKLKEQDGYWLDERFGLGGQDDSDICFRAQKLGYKVGIARDVFVFHYGSATFRQEFKNDIPYSQNYSQSRVKILRDKYNYNMKDGYGLPSKIENSIQAQENNVSLDKRLIMICVPTMGVLRYEMVVPLIHYSHSRNYRVIVKPVYYQPLDAARNQCVKDFLEISNHPDDRLWFIDDDIIPSLDAMDRLFGHNKDIVGATCMVITNKGGYFPYPVALIYNEDRNFVNYQGEYQGLVKIDATGGGCIMIKRKVFEQMDRPYEYKYYPDGTLELVADFRFCQKATELGFEIWYDFETVCDHIKPVSILSISEQMKKLQMGMV